MQSETSRRNYDHRFRQLIHKTGDVELAIRNGVPRSTARDWSRSAASDVVSIVTSDEFRHVPIGTLAILAQRLGRVFASPQWSASPVDSSSKAIFTSRRTSRSSSFVR